MVRYGNGDERTAKPTERFRLKIRNIPFPLSSVNYALRRVGGIMNNDIPPPFRSATLCLRRNEDVAPLAQHRLTFSQSSKGLATPPPEGDSAISI